MIILPTLPHPQDKDDLWNELFSKYQVSPY